MKLDSKNVRKIYDKTHGRCHLCRKQLSFSNYGKLGKRGAWEFEHSLPRASGGSDHLNNLYPACTSCNRSKGSATTYVARGENGYKCAPLSLRKKKKNAMKGAVIGGFIAFFVPPPIRLATAIFGIVTGAAVGHDYEPD